MRDGNNVVEANATCRTCLTRYYRCSDCLIRRNNGMWTWKVSYCSHLCFAIGSVLDDYKKGAISKLEAKEKLTHAMIGHDEMQFPEDVASVIDDIMSDSDLISMHISLPGDKVSPGDGKLATYNPAEKQSLSIGRKLWGKLTSNTEK